MTSNHADFSLGTGPDARWLGSVADVGGPVELAGLAMGPTASGAALFEATDPDAYQRYVATLVTHQRDTQVTFAAVPGLDNKSGWPWLAATSAGWYAYAFIDGRVQVTLPRRPVVHPRPTPP